MSLMKALRLKKELKQKELSLLTGYSKSAISLYENGKQRPSMEGAYRISKALDASIEELFFIDKQEQEVL